MLKWVVSIMILLVGAFIVYSLLLGVSLRRASLIGGINSLRVAQADYRERGYVTNYPASGYRVWLSTNVVNIGGTQYWCFAETDGGWGYDGGALAMTSNQVFIWLDSKRSPKIITLGHKPPIFSGPY